LPSGEVATDGIIRSAWDAVAEALHFNQEVINYDELMQAVRDVLVFVVVPPLDDQLLDELCQHLPGVIFFYLAGSRGREVFTGMGLPQAEFLDPELDPEREKEGLLDYQLSMITS
jgi:hypothetical protein